MLSFFKSALEAVIAVLLAIVGIGSTSPAIQPPNSEVALETSELTQLPISNPNLEIKTPPTEDYKAKIKEQGGESEGQELLYECVGWARANSRFSPPIVKYAKDLKITTQIPRPGSWIVFGEGYFGKLGHVGLVMYVDDYNLTFRRFKFPRGEERIMTININDSWYNILGYYYE